MPVAPTTEKIAGLFRKTPVLEMRTISRAVKGRSQRSVFRDLDALGYLSSYTHTGRFYTLLSVPDFDADGLWCYQGVGFSRDGTLKRTVQRLVEAAEAGRTQHELQLRLGVRVHNPLHELVMRKRLRRQVIVGEYVYVAAPSKQAAMQLAARRDLLVADYEASMPQGPSLEVEVLLEVIHGARVPPPDAAMLTARLRARGIRSSVAEVEGVLARHGLKKTLPSHSPRSPR